MPLNKETDRTLSHSSLGTKLKGVNIPDCMSFNHSYSATEVKIQYQLEQKIGENYSSVGFN